jgi:hypothetical protein
MVNSFSISVLDFSEIRSKIHGKELGLVGTFGIHNGIVGDKVRIARDHGVRNHYVDSAVALAVIGKLQSRGHGIADTIEEVTTFISPMADFANDDFQ